jgi:4-hydroxy-tetrahydrodipicolinate synthase
LERGLIRPGLATIMVRCPAAKKSGASLDSPYRAANNIHNYDALNSACGRGAELGLGLISWGMSCRVLANMAELGADAALVITPYYARPTQEGLFQWYATVAQQNPGLPIVIYNVPSRTAVDIAPETIARLRRQFDNIVGVKETTRDFEHFSRVLHVCGRDTLVWSGIELLCLPLLALGGAGFVSAVANLAPAAGGADV